MKRILFVCAFAAIAIVASAQGTASADTTKTPVVVNVNVVNNNIVATATPKPANPRAGKVTFQGYADVGMVANGTWVGPTIDVSLGARIYDYAYLGVESGVNYVFNVRTKEDGETISGGYVPFGVIMRGYCPLSNKIYAFGGFTVGGAYVDNKNPIRFHCQFLAGFDFSRFNLGVGWNRFYNMDSFLLKVGVRFGK